jgi:hypothetical protein
MKKITNWVRQHQLIAFFLITFTISWGLGFSYYAMNTPGQELLIPLAAVATCGPALAWLSAPHWTIAAWKMILECKDFLE